MVPGQEGAGQPRGLTLIYAAGQGSGRERGLSHPGQEGLLMRRGGQAGASGDPNALFDALEKTSERTEHELRSQVQTSAQGTRQELSGLLAEFQRSIGAQVTGTASLQTGQINAFAQ